MIFWTHWLYDNQNLNWTNWASGWQAGFKWHLDYKQYTNFLPINLTHLKISVFFPKHLCPSMAYVIKIYGVQLDKPKLEMVQSQTEPNKIKN